MEEQLQDTDVATDRYTGSRTGIAGRVYVKSRGVVIKQRAFKSKESCKGIVKDFLKHYGALEVVVAME